MKKIIISLMALAVNLTVLTAEDTIFYGNTYTSAQAVRRSYDFEAYEAAVKINACVNTGDYNRAITLLEDFWPKYNGSLYLPELLPSVKLSLQACANAITRQDSVNQNFLTSAKATRDNAVQYAKRNTDPKWQIKKKSNSTVSMDNGQFETKLQQDAEKQKESFTKEEKRIGDATKELTSLYAKVSSIYKGVDAVNLKTVAKSVELTKEAEAAFDAGNFNQAEDQADSALRVWKNNRLANVLMSDLVYKRAVKAFDEKDYNQALILAESSLEYNSSNGKASELQANAQHYCDIKFYVYIGLGVLCLAGVIAIWRFLNKFV